MLQNIHSAGEAAYPKGSWAIRRIGLRDYCGRITHEPESGRACGCPTHDKFVEVGRWEISYRYILICEAGKIKFFPANKAEGYECLGGVGPGIRSRESGGRLKRRPSIPVGTGRDLSLPAMIPVPTSNDQRK